MTRIVSVQDISCLGQCSQTVALPILSSRGIETAILPSGILSNHTGSCFSGFTFLDLTDEMQKIIHQWKREGITFDGIYTGYIGDPRQFDMILECKFMMREGGLLIVDPAMADFGKLYAGLSQSIVEGMKRLVSGADVILPNMTEAAFLLNRECKDFYSKEEIKDMLYQLSELGPKIVILTGVSYEEGKIGAAAYCRDTGIVTEYFTSRVDRLFHGTGDVFASIVVADLMQGVRLQDTLQDACEFVMASIRKTLADPDHDYGVCFEQVLQDERR